MVAEDTVDVVVFEGVVLVGVDTAVEGSGRTDAAAVLLVVVLEELFFRTLEARIEGHPLVFLGVQVVFSMATDTYEPGR